MKSFLLVLTIGALLSFAACGGGGTGVIHPTPANYTISANVTGLNSGANVVLQDNGGNNLTVNADGTFSFTTLVPLGSPYSVSVLTQPTGQTCTPSNNTGTATSNVTVAVACASSSAPTYTISASVTGLTSGSLELQDNDGDTLTFTINTTLTFATKYASGASYGVTPVTQPAGQNCTVSNSSGTITANITLAVTCVPVSSTDTISVSVTGLTGTLVVQDNQGDSLTFTTNSTQTFAKTYTSGSTYSVTVSTQPAGQTCTLSSNATGTITSNITVTATCTTNVTNDTISVATTGLIGTLVVQDSKSDKLTFTTSSTQTFATSYASGSTYSVTVLTQPAGQTCTLSSNSTGTITANTTVTATCVTNPTYTISVAVTGLTGTLVVQDSQSDSLTFTTNSTQTFAKAYASGSTYSVTVETQPSGETCTLSSNASGTITSNITVTATCAASGSGFKVSVAVTGLSGTVTLEDDQSNTLTFTSNGTQTFANTYTAGATYTVSVTIQPSAQACTPTYSTATINSNTTISVACATGATRALGTVSGVSTIACSGSIANGACQQMTVSCPGVPDVQAYVKTNTPSGTVLGTVTYNTGTDGNGLYDSIFTFGSTAVGNVLSAGYTTVQISWGTPFNSNQPAGWVQGPGGVLASACRYATVTNWIYNNIQKNTNIPMCATANSGGAGALAYALSQYPSSNILSMAEVTSGPPTGRLDWGCGCKQGAQPVQCGATTTGTLGTCFGKTDGGVWDPAYNPNVAIGTGVCGAATQGTLPPGGLNFFLGDSVEAPGASYNFPKTYVNLVFGGADTSSAIPIGQDWFDNITSTKAQACVANGVHSLANTLPGAQQIANDLINLCKLQ